MPEPKPAPSEASTDPASAIPAAERALAAGDAAACLQLCEPLLTRLPQARQLAARAHERLSEQRAGVGAHAEALWHYQQFHHLVVEALRQERAGALTEDAIDAETGLATRQALESRGPAMLQQALGSKSGLCLVSIELDPLQPTRLGLTPGLGTAVLREIGALLRAHSRAKDLPLRYAGETLVLLLSDVELSLARNICERIRRAVQSHDWRAQHPELRVSLSMGLTALRSGDSIASLLARAEAGLVSARRDGRNCVRTGVIGV